ncbi:hypothetical protein FXB40_01970 [Bradyrhizobium rifense]|uniref:Uncharacterized protein n=1 Tax=Bradyrhizobium rifense TaxID=515499 RepID=A0A5D3L0Q9_9BRAD|nr:hypothetical protein FXB40_01970 [Bradyrhizobium rifense]
MSIPISRSSAFRRLRYSFLASHKILTTPEEVETWMTAPSDETLILQRPLPDGALRIVARGVKEDAPGSTI